MWMHTMHPIVVIKFKILTNVLWGVYWIKSTEIIEKYTNKAPEASRFWKLWLHFQGRDDKIMDYLPKIDEFRMKLNTLRKVEKTNNNSRDTKINENSKSKYGSTWILHKLEKINQMKKKQIFRDEFKILEGIALTSSWNRLSRQFSWISKGFRYSDFLWAQREIAVKGDFRSS